MMNMKKSGSSFVANRLKERGATPGEATRMGDMKKKAALAAAAKRAAENNKRRPGETEAQRKTRMKADSYGNPRE
jgi:hypothetical protein